MRFRVRSALGELKIRSRAGHGTSIHARLPLESAAGDEAPESAASRGASAPREPAQETTGSSPAERDA
jgi:hypothetical protein